MFFLICRSVVKILGEDSRRGEGEAAWVERKSVLCLDDVMVLATNQ